MGASGGDSPTDKQVRRPLLGSEQPAPSSVWLLCLAVLLVAVPVSLRLVAVRGGAARTTEPIVAQLDGGDVPAGSGDAADLAAVAALLAAWPADKPKACITVLARNSDLTGVISSVRKLERTFNAAPDRRYPYCFLNDAVFSAEFRRVTSSITDAPCFYGQVPREHWEYPPHIDVQRAAETRAQAKGRMPYGGSESYRFIYFSGFFFDHPLLAGFDYYWRVEPNVHFWCLLEEDPFRRMHARNYSLEWTIMVAEAVETIPSLWAETQRWLSANPQHIASHNLLPAFVKEGRDGEQLYTSCHMWSNFEIGRLSFFRSPQYRSFFSHLDKAGGFFYERWGDAPVHTLGAAALLDRSQVHFADDIGYGHGTWMSCPTAPEYRQRCACNPFDDIHVGAQPWCTQDFHQRLAALERRDGDAAGGDTPATSL